MTQNATLTQQRLGGLIAAFQARAADFASARGEALGMLAGQVRREAYVMAYSDAFWIIGVLLVVSLGAVTLLKKPGGAAAPVEAH